MLAFPKDSGKKLKPIVKQLDSLVSKIVIARDKKCVLCGSKTALGCGHWIRRRFYPVRWNLTNCNCLCNICNERDDREPIHYATWMENNYGSKIMDEFEKINIWETVKPIEQYAIYSELTEIAKQYGVKAAKLPLTN